VSPAPAPELRETSSATTRLVLGYLRAQRGEQAVAEVLERSGLPHTAQELERPERWFSYDTRIRLFEAAAAYLDDPQAMARIGASAVWQNVNPSMVLAMRALGSPAQIYRRLPPNVAKYSTTSTMLLLEAGDTTATFSFRLHDGYVPSRLDCAYARGLIAVIPEGFGLPPANITHQECQADGAPACIYHVSWATWSRWSRRRRRAGVQAELERQALHRQLTDLQSAAADLVSSDDLEQVLAQITERAASAVLAPGYLLAVHPDGGEPPLVQSFGVDPGQVAALSARLLGDGDLGSTAVVVEVASARRQYGRLAALYDCEQGQDCRERDVLAAYARHAAAALDMLSALEASRRAERRATALLALSHNLAETDDPQTVAEVVAAALPDVVGCTSASVFLWDGDEQVLRGAANGGPEAVPVELFQQTRITAADVPALGDAHGITEPLVLEGDSVGPELRTLFTVLDVEHVIAVPLLAGGELHGVATASWRRPPTGREQQDELMLRLSGVGDQASTALRNARLVAAIRHQAQHDPLTGLPNRRLFLERLERALATDRRALPGGVAVLFCDLDRFKAVNDALGHAAGDELLCQVAQRLAGAVRSEDRVGRLSGDEFAALLPTVVDRAAAEAVAQRIVESFAEPFVVQGRELRMTTSVGVALQVGAGGRPDRLLRAADEAMYLAKQEGRNQIASAA